MTQTDALPTDALVVYLSCEFGLTQNLPIYSGGLGMLAGDHLKAASDLGVPLVGVGLFYAHGYFRQELSPDGHQVAAYDRNDPAQMPLQLVTDAAGEPLEVAVTLVGEAVRLRVWRYDVGTVPLYLLDTDVEGNSADARAITDTLYGGDRITRIRQEMVLGVGAWRLLRALKQAPTVLHLNEGHSAFVQVERLRELVNVKGMTLDEGLDALRRGCVFTTHTPVPAGNEQFTTELISEYLTPILTEIGLPLSRFLELGRVTPDGDGFGMTPFALRTTQAANGVAQLHGEVAREMWAPMWPDLKVKDVPIGAVTNGVHAPTWTGRPVAALLEGAGIDVAARPQDTPWGSARDIDAAAVWAAKNTARQELITALPGALEGTGASDADIATAAGLHPDALTIGFARRFATYKRAGLLFSDLARLERLVGDAERPVQVLFAGKAHPADSEGQALMAHVVEWTRTSALRDRMVFLVGYDMDLAQRLVAGVDVWLNNPRRPQEASGTSGMKAALNGALNVSIPDGWWPEADPGTGWTIGDEAWAEQGVERDAKDAESLYALLEGEVVPTFYDRDADGVPVRWIEMSRNAIAGAGEFFTTARMVDQYVREYYVPADRASRALPTGGL
ncbi:MAG: alpha-glucan family phosphorylase [Thermoleophilia bacterium]|nr:alpha-glucan family phosphorylase [Thermoleophilia bacterium]